MSFTVDILGGAAMGSPVGAVVGDSSAVHLAKWSGLWPGGSAQTCGELSGSMMCLAGEVAQTSLGSRSGSGPL